MDGTADTIALMKEALAKAMPATSEDLAKAFTQSNSATTGLTYYDLQAPALTLYPVITPLRNKLPRVTGGRGIQANWKAITVINANNISVGVSEGNRGGVLSTTVVDYYAAFRTIGVEDSVTFEADLAADGFDDLKARAVQGNLRSLMIGEEKMLLAGNGGGQALGQVGTVTLSTATTGGALSNGTYYAACVALTLQGYEYATSNLGVTGQITRTNADGSSDTYGSGCSRASAIASLAVAGGGAVQTLTASVTPIKGAVAYAWFMGSANAYASLFFAGVTSTSRYTLTGAIPGSGNVIPADLQSNDRSTNALHFDGFITMAAKTGSGSYWNAVSAGSTLTADGTGGIVELDTALQWFWDNLRIAPSEIWVHAQQMLDFRKKVLTGSSNAGQRFVFQTTQNGLVGSSVIKGYLNPFTMSGGQEVPVNLHPNCPPGTIVFLTHELPYSLSGVTTVNRVLCRRDYYQLEWPLRTRKYEYGVYSDQVLQCYFLPGIGVITNISPG